MSSPLARLGWVGALIGAGFACPGHAGPTPLEDALSLVEGRGAKSESDFDPAAASLPPSLRASAPLSDTAGAARMKRAHSTPDGGEMRFHREQSDAFSVTPATAGPSLGMPDKVVPPQTDLAGRVGQPARPGDASAVIKERALSALGWMHEVLPWTAGKPADLARDIATLPADSNVLPMETESGRFFSVKADRSRVEPDPAAAAAQRAGLPMPSEPGVDRRQTPDLAATNSVRQAVKIAREVLVHPLTWLVIVLVGIAQIVVSRSSRSK